MNRYQRTALERPVLLASEAMLPRYWHRVPGASIVVTINTGYE